MISNFKWGVVALILSFGTTQAASTDESLRINAVADLSRIKMENTGEVSLGELRLLRTGGHGAVGFTWPGGRDWLAFNTELGATVAYRSGSDMKSFLAFNARQFFEFTFTPGNLTLAPFLGLGLAQTRGVLIDNQYVDRSNTPYYSEPDEFHNTVTARGWLYELGIRVICNTESFFRPFMQLTYGDLYPWIGKQEKETDGASETLDFDRASNMKTNIIAVYAGIRYEL